MSKISYLGRCLINQLNPTRYCCPNCAADAGKVVDSKFVITQLRRCKSCDLLYRTPTDDPNTNRAFYDGAYSQGFTTDVPDSAELQEMMRNNFLGTPKDYTYYVDVLRRLGILTGARVFDFGCSWGYGSFQFAAAGFEVTAFEIAPGRRDFARSQLNINIVEDMNQITKDPGHARKYDCFFSAHVLEHVPSPRTAFEYARLLLKPGGLFVSFTPNGCDEFRAVESQWSDLWGEVHPNFIDRKFLERAFRQNARVYGSSPVANASVPENNVSIALDNLDRAELFFAARL